MSTITLPNIRVSSDLTVKVSLKDGGVAIDWSTLSNIKAHIYSDAQRALAGRCSVSVDEDDATVLVCTYAANKPQYVGVNRIVVSAKYMGEMKTYDKPAFNFVRWTEDQEGEEITIDDPDVDVEIEVEDVSSSILQEAVDAANTAAERANDAAEAAEHMVDIHTGPQGKSAYEVAVDEGYTGTEEEWLASLKGDTGETPDITIGTVTTAEPGTPAAATMTGTPEDPVLNLTIPKGAVGATPNFTVGTVTTGAPGSSVIVTITGTAEAPVLNVTIPQGMQGNTGSSVDYPYELVNNLTTNDSTKGLSAAQGVVLAGQVSQLEQEVDGYDTPTYTDKELVLDKGFNTNNDPMSSTPVDSTGSACFYGIVTPGEKYRIIGLGGNKYARLWVITDASRNKIREAELNENTRNNPLVLTIGEGEARLIVTFSSYNSTTDKVQLVGSVHQDGLVQKVSDIEDEIEQISDDIDDVKDDVDAVEASVDGIEKDIDGYDTTTPEEQELTLDKTFNTNNDPMSETPVTSSGYACFYGIVTPGEKYRITGLGGNKYNILWVVTDASRNKVRQAELGENTRNNPVTLTIGEGEARLYVCFSSYDSTTDKLEKIVTVHTPGIKDDIQELQNEIGREEVAVCVPDVIDAIVGDTLQLYYRSIFRCVDFSKYSIHLDCNIGAQYPRYYEVTPTASQVGNHSIEFTIKDNNNNVLGTKTAILSVKSVAASPSSEVNVLCVGASGTGGGQWPSELKRRLVGTGGTPAGSERTNIVFVGSKDVTFDGKQVNVEATGGYSFPSYTSVSERSHSFTFTEAKPFGSANVGDVYSYDGHNCTIKEINITDGVGNISCSSDYAGSISATNGTLTKVSGEGSASMDFASCRSYGNPFVYNGVIDIQQYADDYCNPQNAEHGKIDIVFTELFGNGTPPYETDPGIRLAQMQAFIDEFRAVFPNCKFCIGLMWNPDIRGGMGVNYGATGSWHDAYAIKYSAMNMCNALQKYITDNNLSEYVFIVNWLNEFDEENDFRQTTKPVNTRSSVTEIFGVNGVHPATVGYYQLADAAWRLFVAKFCQS